MGGIGSGGARGGTAQVSKIDPNVVSKFSKKIQSAVTFAKKGSWGKYHIVVNDPKFGEASFHGTNIGDMKWEISAFLRDGSRD